MSSYAKFLGLGPITGLRLEKCLGKWKIGLVSSTITSERCAEKQIQLKTHSILHCAPAFATSSCNVLYQSVVLYRIVGYFADIIHRAYAVHQSAAGNRSQNET